MTDRAEAIWRSLRETSRTWDATVENIFRGFGDGGRRVLYSHKTTTDGLAMCHSCVPAKVIVPAGTPGMPESLGCPRCGGPIVWMVVPEYERFVVLGASGSHSGATLQDWAVDTVGFLGGCLYPGCEVRRGDLVARWRFATGLSQNQVVTAYWQRVGEPISRRTVARLTESWWPTLWSRGPVEATDRWARKREARRVPREARRWA